MHKAGKFGGAGLSRTYSGRSFFSMLRSFAGACAVVVLSLVAAGASAQPSGHLPTTTQLSASQESDGSRTTFTVRVLGGDRGVPSGAVSLSDGTNSLGSALLDEKGAASFTASTATAQRITAIYEGDGSFEPSSSLTLGVSAASTVPTFSLSGSPTTLSVKAGNFVTTTITVTPANGFNQVVQLSCSGLPTNSTCAFNPVNVTPNGTSPATSTLTIQTVAQTGAGTTGSLRQAKSRRTSLYAALLPGLGALVGLGLLRKRGSSVVRFFGIAALLAGCAIGLSACSPRYDYFAHPPNTDPGTTIGTFTVLVSGSSANAGTVIIPTPVSILLTVTK